jgi:hypothetical protein
VRVGAAGAIINIGYHMELDGRVMFHIDGWRDFIMSIHIQTIGQALILTARSTTRTPVGTSVRCLSSTIINCSCGDHVIS